VTPADAEEEARAAVRASVDEAAFQGIETFVRCCQRWAAVQNLVSDADRARLWSRHVLDSLQLVPLGRGQAFVDLGSGAGFPGLVVAIARPETAMTLVESNRKKAAFLVQAAAECRVRVRVEPRRAEFLPAIPFDTVSARAVAPLERLLDLAERFFDEATVGLFPKGREAPGEVAAARCRFAFDFEEHPSRTEPGGVVLAVTALRRL
jgi:16S rRNA (guanine527-N7)-methyltransferase